MARDELLQPTLHVEVQLKALAGDLKANSEVRGTTGITAIC
jgi:hypothetical protein